MSNFDYIKYLAEGKLYKNEPINETVNFEEEEYDIVSRDGGWVYLRSVHDTKVGKKEIKVKEEDITVNEHTSSVSKRRAGAELKQKIKGKRADGMGKYTGAIYGLDTDGKRVELKSLNDLNKFNKFELGESVNEGSPGYSKFIFSLQTLIGDIAPNAWEDKSQIDSTSMKRIHNSLKKRYGDDYAKYNDLLKTQKGQFGNWYLKESVNEAKLITEYSDQEILDLLLKSKASAIKNDQPGLSNNLQKHIKDLQKKIKMSKKESINEGDSDPMSNLLQTFEKAMTDKATYDKVVAELEGAADHVKPKLMQMADEIIPEKRDELLELIDDLENDLVTPDDLDAPFNKDVLIQQFKEFVKITDFTIATIKKYTQ